MTQSISICIPCYEMHGRGVEFLTRLLVSINQQTYRNFEVVVSDHSVTDEIRNCLLPFDTKFQITYIKNDYNRGNSSANVNVAISYAKNSLIKIMFQDDFFINENALSIISRCENGWGAVGFVHTDKTASQFFRPFLPRLNGLIALGNNTMGCPSVLHFHKKPETIFDEELIWLMDCEFYQRLLAIYGIPIIYDEICLAVRLWEDSLSGSVTDIIKSKELEYVKGKYGF